MISKPAPGAPSAHRVKLDAETTRDALAGSADAEAGRTVDLSPEELAEWEATGELPASVQARLAALECSESSG